MRTLDIYFFPGPWRNRETHTLHLEYPLHIHTARCSILYENGCKTITFFARKGWATKYDFEGLRNLGVSTCQYLCRWTDGVFFGQPCPWTAFDMLRTVNNHISPSLDDWWWRLIKKTPSTVQSVQSLWPDGQRKREGVYNFRTERSRKTPFPLPNRDLVTLGNQGDDLSSLRQPPPPRKESTSHSQRVKTGLTISTQFKRIPVLQYFPPPTTRGIISGFSPQHLNPIVRWRNRFVGPAIYSLKRKVSKISRVIGKTQLHQVTHQNTFVQHPHSAAHPL